MVTVEEEVVSMVVVTSVHLQTRNTKPLTNVRSFGDKVIVVTRFRH